MLAIVLVTALAGRWCWCCKGIRWSMMFGSPSCRFLLEQFQTRLVDIWGKALKRIESVPYSYLIEMFVFLNSSFWNKLIVAVFLKSSLFWNAWLMDFWTLLSSGICFTASPTWFPPGLTPSHWRYMSHYRDPRSSARRCSLSLVSDSSPGDGEPGRWYLRRQTHSLCNDW